MKQFFFKVAWETYHFCLNIDLFNHGLLLLSLQEEARCDGAKQPVLSADWAPDAQHQPALHADLQCAVWGTATHVWIMTVYIKFEKIFKDFDIQFSKI